MAFYFIFIKHVMLCYSDIYHYVKLNVSTPVQQTQFNMVIHGKFRETILDILERN